MIKRIINFFKKKIRSAKKKDEKKEQDEDYIPSEQEVQRFYRKFLKLDYKQIIFKNISTILRSIISAKQPFLLVRIKNSLIENNLDDLQQAFLGYFLCILLRQTLNQIQSFLSQSSLKKMKEEILTQTFDRLFSLDMQYFEENKVTQISQLIKNGALQICSQLNQSKLLDKVDSYIYCLSSIYFIYSVSPLILVSMLILSLMSNLFLMYLKSKQSEIQKIELQRNEFKDFALDDILNNVIVIKSFGTEQKEIQNLTKIMDQNKINAEQNQKYSKITQIFKSISYAINNIIIILQIFFYCSFEEDKRVFASTLSEIIGYSCYTFQITYDILKLFQSQQVDYYEKRRQYFGKVMKLFEIVPKIKQDFESNSSDDSLFQGEITFDNACFSYPVSNDHLAQMKQQIQEEEKQKKKNNEEQATELISSVSDSNLEIQSNSSADESKQKEQPEENQKKNQTVIKNLSFSIKKGQFVAFVGKSGSGKSTIIKLIQRLYDLTSGAILLDGQNIKDVSLNKLRRSIGLVSQEPSLFDNDIEYNITYGCQNDSYTQEELKHICDISGVSEFVFDEKRFPEGLKTLVGSKGMKLSGGQKQRVAIARALIKKPKILILDEATSSLDAESENTVQQYIDQLVEKRGMTIIVVAHRLSTIIKSDNIFVMKNGELKEQGTHQSLLAQNGIYSKLIHHQLNFENKKI